MISFSNPVPDADLVVISLGAGVQSSVLALMAARGEVSPLPDCAIFSDTQWEPPKVYEYLDWLETQLPFPVHRVTAGNIREDAINGMNTTGQRFATMPFFTLTEKGAGLLRRQCTKEYKIGPVRKKIREILGLKKGERSKYKVEQWIGISTDEMVRMKESRDKWVINRWPLIEQGMTRFDCLKWAEDRQIKKPTRSACIGCPFRSDKEWLEMKKNDPESFADAVSFDAATRNDQRGKITAELYLHSSMKPLGEVVFGESQISFLDECEGMCGV